MKNLLSYPTLFLLLGAIHSNGAVNAVTGGVFVPAQNPIVNTAIISSFTTSQGTVSSLAGASSISGTFQTNPSYGPSQIRNFWGSAGTEVDGVASLVGLDASVGIPNVALVNAQFGVTIQGAAGSSNDFFILESGTGDAITLVPLNGAGNPIGDFTFNIGAGAWGAFNPYQFVGDGITTSNSSIAGVAFDLEDFIGTGTLTGVTGLRITSSNSLDPVVIGYNTQAVPEPSALLIVACGMGFFTFLRRRRL